MSDTQRGLRTAFLLGLLVMVAGTVGATYVVAPAGPASASSAGSPRPVTVAVRGTLLVRPAERPGLSTSYAVALGSGEIVPVRGSFPPGLRTGTRFAGSLALPASLVTALRSRDAGAVADPRSVPPGPLPRDGSGVVPTLVVTGTPTLRPPAESSSAATGTGSSTGTGTVHREFVAAIDNHGSLGQTDDQLLGHVDTVGDYWKGEAGSAISGLVLPGSVRHFSSTSAAADCGLGTDFWGVVQEAEQLFPGIDPFGGSDELVVFVPPGCSSGSVVGMGTLGSGFASGGAVVVQAGASINGTFAHETGHTYGLQHANALAGSQSLEYYGVYDVMGFAIGGVNQLTALSTPYRVEQGITETGEIQPVQIGDDGQTPVHTTISLRPRSAGTGVRSIEVTDPDTGAALYLDYRSGDGQDAGSLYAGGSTLASPVGGLRYRRGVVINEIRGSGDDTLVEDGDTALVTGSTWTNASGTLSVTVGSTTAEAASVTVDYDPPAVWTSLGHPVVSGDVRVGGRATVDVGTWAPTPTRVEIRWYAGGRHLAGADDRRSITPCPTVLGQDLVAEVTAYGAGVPATSEWSAPVTVQAGTLHVSDRPAVVGTARVGATLRAVSATVAPALAAVSSSWQWRVNGVPVPGATGRTFVPRPADRGATVTVRETFTATGYRPARVDSPRTSAVGRR